MMPERLQERPDGGLDRTMCSGFARSGRARSWARAGAGMVVSSTLLMACLGERAVPQGESVNSTPVAGVSRPSDAPHGKAARADSPALQPWVSQGAGQPAVATSADAAAVLARGSELYARHCAACHGEQGDGAGPFADMLNPRPRSFVDEAFKLYTTQNEIPSDDDLMRTLRRGMPGSAMPPWDHLPQSDLQALVQFVRLLHRQGAVHQMQELVDEGLLNPEDMPAEVARRTVPGTPLVIPPEATFDDVAWFRGRQLYLQNCAACHGPDGHPVMEAVMADPQGYPVPPRSFVNGIFKGGSEGDQLYARIRLGMRGTPMPASDHEGLPDEQIWDLIHYVQSLAQPGSQERAQLRMDTVRAVAVEGDLPAGPTAPAWDRAPAVYVALTPQWWSEDRIGSVMVQGLHNSRRIAFRLSWIDETADVRAVGQHEFRDGVAMQFAAGQEPPFYMGDPRQSGAVHVWYWKADRQQDLDDERQDIHQAFPHLAVDHYDPAPNGRPEHLPDPAASLVPFRLYLASWAAGNIVADPEQATPVESLVARGPGTLYAPPSWSQEVDGRGIHERGVWYVQMQRDLKSDVTDGVHPLAFGSKEPMYLAVAVWDGSAGDRAGKKNFSMWQRLVLD
jgi:mono/diheme cytochrome c family protein